MKGMQKKPKKGMLIIVLGGKPGKGGKGGPPLPMPMPPKGKKAK